MVAQGHGSNQVTTRLGKILKRQRRYRGGVCKKTLLPEGSCAALAGWISRCSPNDSYRLTEMRFFDIIFARVPHVFMHHASEVQCWT
jgi:hypothetical protein